MPDDSSHKPIRKIDDTTHEALPENPIRRRLVEVKRWFLLDANRNTVAGLLLLGSFLTIVLAGSFGPVPVQSFLTEGVSPGIALVELLKVIVSVVVIVLSINQLVLSPGLGPVGEQWERFDQSVNLREQVQEHTDVRISPTSPAPFLGVLLDAIADQAEQIDRTMTHIDGHPLQGEIGEFTESVQSEAESVRELISSSRFGGFGVVSVALRFAVSEKVHSFRAFQQADETSFPPPLAEAFDEMYELLELFTVAREYLKTIYIRGEYISLSEGLLYTGLPAILLTYVASQIYTSSVFPGQILGVEKQLLFVSAAVTIALSPLVLLIAYGFRLAMLSRSTLFVGPFDARQTGKASENVQRRGR